MNKFYGDNFLVTVLCKLCDCIFANILWLVASVPIITLGASTTALYYTVNKSIRRDRGTVWKSFWYSFRQNFKISTPIFLLYLGLIAVLAGLMFACNMIIQAHGTRNFVTAFMLVLVNILLVLLIFTLSYTARFYFSAIQLLKNGVLIAFLNMQWAFLLWSVLSAAACLCFMFSPLILIMPTLFMLIASIILERVFKKYMSEEDIETERIQNS